VCEEKIRDSIDSNTVLDILAVTYLPYMEKRADVQDLRRKALTYLLEHLTAIDLSPLRKLPPVIALDVLFACQAHEAKLPIPDLSSSTAVGVGAAPSTPSATPAAGVPSTSPRTVPAPINTELRAPSSPALSPKMSPRKEDGKKDKKKDKKEKKDKKKKEP